MTTSSALPRRHSQRTLVELLRAINEMSIVEREVFDRIAVFHETIDEVSAAMNRAPAWVLCVTERVEEKLRSTRIGAPSHRHGLHPLAPMSDASGWSP